MIEEGTMAEQVNNIRQGRQNRARTMTEQEDNNRKETMTGQTDNERAGRQ